MEKRKIVFGMTGMMFLMLMVIVAGCGQNGGGGSQTALSTDVDGKGGYSIKGLVYDSALGKGNPISGARVALSGTSLEATTGTDGSYSFSNVQFGSYRVSAIKAGYQNGFEVGQFNAPVAGAVLTLDIALNNSPIITSMYPKAGSTISADLKTFTVSFNESMNPDTVSPSLQLLSLRAQGISALGILPITRSWDSDNKTLTVTVNDALVRGATYVFSIPSDAKDLEGNHLSYYSSPSVTFNTASTVNLPPGKPTGLNISNGVTTEVDYRDVSNAYSTVKLSWNATDNAVGYRVFASYNGGPYQQLGSENYGGGDTILYQTNLDISPAMVDTALADFTRNGNYSPMDPGLPWPFLGSGINLKVETLNPLGEAFSDALLVRDTVKPTVNQNIWANTPTTEVIIYFSEPVEKGSAVLVRNYLATDANGNSIEVKKVEYNFSNTSVALSLASLIDKGGTIEVNSQIKDLSGNEMNQESNRGTIMY